MAFLNVFPQWRVLVLSIWSSHEWLLSGSIFKSCVVVGAQISIYMPPITNLLEQSRKLPYFQNMMTNIGVLTGKKNLRKAEVWILLLFFETTSLKFWCSIPILNITVGLIWTTNSATNNYKSNNWKEISIHSCNELGIKGGWQRWKCRCSNHRSELLHAKNRRLST